MVVYGVDGLRSKWNKVEESTDLRKEAKFEGFMLRKSEIGNLTCCAEEDT